MEISDMICVACGITVMIIIILVVSVISMTTGGAKSVVDVMRNARDFDMTSIQNFKMLSLNLSEKFHGVGGAMNFVIFVISVFLVTKCGHHIWCERHC